jgi:hypothetical protein
MTKRRRRRGNRNEAVVRRVLALYAAGATLRACGEAVGITRSAAWNIIYDRGIRKGPHRLDAAQRDRLVAAYREGATLAAAALAGCCSVPAAWQVLKALGVLRPRHRATPVQEAIAARIAELGPPLDPPAGDSGRPTLGDAPAPARPVPPGADRRGCRNWPFPAVTDADRAAIVAGTQAGLTAWEIAQQLGLQVAEVRKAAAAIEATDAARNGDAP